jgi:hypothetical protein
LALAKGWYLLDSNNRGFYKLGLTRSLPLPLLSLQA